MSALMNSIGLSDDNTSVTKISANARIDYILRFTKQAILVIDESSEQNAQITNQFIATIPEQHNAAYISLSNQFSDIQVRCRIIEQLSAGELFDPEISLAVSIVNLARKSQQAISIVLDNTQHLSLQLLHEASQLTAIAKKANLVINVIMFGSPQAGIKIQENQNLFHNKLTLLSAQSGQLLSANAAIFQKVKVKWYTIKINKWLLAAFVLLFALAATVIVLLQQDSFNFTGLPKAEGDKKIDLSAVLTEPQTTVLNKNTAIVTLLAEPNDVYLSLIAPKINPLEIKVAEAPAPATPNDMMIAMTSLSLTNDSEVNNTLESVKLTRAQQNIDHQEIAAESSIGAKKSMTGASEYYLAHDTGFVIQIAAFSDIVRRDEFIRNLADVEYHVYQRLLNGVAVFVITSPIYADRILVEQQLLTMPESIRLRQPWIKSIKVINSEINVFQDSQ
jgi:DamX protein